MELQFYKLVKVMDDPLTYLIKANLSVDLPAADICES